MSLRIISLVPSITELLFYFGLQEEVVGVTKFCIHPTIWFKSKTRVGGTKQVKHHIIEQLQPSLILANKEENTREDIEFLQTKYPVYVSDISTIDEAFAMIKQVGVLVQKEHRAEELLGAIQHQFMVPLPLSKSALYFIWHKPYMVAGANTFINSMMMQAGFRNVIEVDRYPALSEKEVIELNPEVILLSTEPFPFKEKHLQTFRELLPQSKILIADGEIFSWYGSRMLKAMPYFRSLNEIIHS